MLASQTISNSNQPVFSDLPVGTTAIRVVEFVKEQLDTFSRKVSGQNLNEEDLSQELVIILLREAAYKGMSFTFVPEYKDLTVGTGKKRKVDIGVINILRNSDSRAFFAVEAKRLPTPLPKTREKEYVQGNLGAIERFKRELHGAGLKVNAIVGYIEQNDFDYWQSQINSWISDLSINNADLTIKWLATETLSSLSKSTVSAHLLSNNCRAKDCFDLHHLWVNIHSQ